MKTNPFTSVALIALMALPTGGTSRASDSALPEKMVVVSSQLQHPIGYGVLAGLSLGLWPENYPSDLTVRPASGAMNQGIGATAATYLIPYNRTIFRQVKGITMVAMGGALLLGYRHYRRRRTAP